MKHISIFLLLFVILGVSAQEVTRGQLLNLYYKAQKAEKAGNNAEALNYYDTILSIDKTLPVPYLKMADIYAADGNNPESMTKTVTLYQHYITLCGASHEVTRGQASALFDKALKAQEDGNSAEALNYYNSILSIDKKSLAPYLKMADIYAADGNNPESTAKAIALYQRYIELDGESDSEEQEDGRNDNGEVSENGALYESALKNSELKTGSSKKTKDKIADDVLWRPGGKGIKLDGLGKKSEPVPEKDVKRPNKISKK
jgi:tetratricopeptide (TPR) repeat protein